MAIIIPPEKVWTCPYGICDGSGTVYDPIKYLNFRCHCWPDLVRWRALGQCGLPEDYQDKTFETLIPDPKYPNQQAVLDRAKGYAREWPVVKNSGECLAIVSPRTGMGKSHLAAAICIYLIEHWWTESVSDQDVCFFVHVPEWFNAWTRHFLRFPPHPAGSKTEDTRYDNPAYHQENDKLSAFEDRMINTELLILDDMSRFEPTNFRLTKLFNVVEKRTANNKPIIITDNVTSWTDVKNKLGELYGSPIADRLDRKGDTLVIQIPLARKGRKKNGE
jgi:DNA replication protein DnaC